ncbi:MAG TPA: hypothetical protein VK338_00815 [Candidatus Nitrosocosmicus sp.]|nr:hypothetical protein [Candidatus Nitrosocosmicus sp.]
MDPKQTANPAANISPDLHAAIDKKISDFREFIEFEVLRIIKELAEKGQTDEEKIQAIAKIVLTTIEPSMSLDELYQAATKLDDRHPELAPLVFKIMKHYEEQYEKQAIDQVANFVRAGQYDEAQNLVKKVLQFKIVN